MAGDYVVIGQTPLSSQTPTRTSRRLLFLTLSFTHKSRQNQIFRDKKDPAHHLRCHKVLFGSRLTLYPVRLLVFAPKRIKVFGSEHMLSLVFSDTFMACSIYGTHYYNKTLHIYPLSALYSFHNIIRVITESILTRTKTSIYIPYLE